MEILDCELVIKFSDFFDAFPQKNANWNCGFTIQNNKYIFLCRNEVSKYSEQYWGKKLSTHYPRAVPTYAEFHEDGNLACVKPVNKSKNYLLSDVRLFQFKGNTFSTGTYRSDKYQPDGKRKVDQFLARQICNNMIFLPFEHSFKLPQKNWTPFISENLFFENYDQVSKCRNLLEYVGGKLKLVNRFYTPYTLRGNCQTIQLEDKLLSIYHYHKNRYYWHYFVLSESVFPFTPIKISKPFRFKIGDSDKSPIQFVMGMEIKNDIYISYGVQDADNYLVRVSLKNIQKVIA